MVSSFSEVITGSRDWTDCEAIRMHLGLNYANCAAALIGYYISVGDCPSGVDLFVREWHDEWYHISRKHSDVVNLTVYEADWDMYGKKAGPIRNQRMLQHSYPDVVSGFLQRGAGNRGTQNTLRTARSMGLVVREYWSDQTRAES